MNQAVPEPADSNGSISGSLPTVGSKVGGYTVTGRLGEGTMGAVFRARDTSSGREVALKLILGAPSPEASLRLAREGRITASLRHPGIVTVHSAGIDQGRPYLVYELVDGTTLEARMEALDRQHLLKIVLDVARAIGHAHAHGDEITPEEKAKMIRGAIAAVILGVFFLVIVLIPKGHETAFDAVTPGMTRAQVVETFGIAADSAKESSGEERLTFEIRERVGRRFRRTEVTTYSVWLRDGRVVRKLAHDE